MIGPSDKNDIKRVEAKMVSAIGRLVPVTEGIETWFRDRLLAGRTRRTRLEDLPPDLRRDIGLASEPPADCALHDWRGRRRRDFILPGPL